MDNILRNFSISSPVKNIEQNNSGHINLTYKVTTENGEKYILQKINNRIFSDVDGLMSNIVKITDYMCRVSDGENNLRVIRTTDNKPYYQDTSGYYRMFNYLEGKTVDTGATIEQFTLAGKGFGRFQSLLNDFDAKELVEPIKDFHNTEKRYENFIQAVEKDEFKRVDECKTEIDFFVKRKAYCSRVLNLIRNGSIPIRVTHNDTKPNNVIIDEEKDKVIAVIDLDTIMPGSVLYDFGDSVRYGANTGAEDETDLSEVNFSVEYYEAFCKGFLPEVASCLTKAEKENISFAGILLTYECGMRFLTDYLSGDTYFRISRIKHNLDRAHTQMKMIEDMEKRTDEMQKIAEKYL